MLVMALAAGCRDRNNPAPQVRQVVVYTALDRGFSEPILQDFEKATGIKALAVYDVESTKTVGLTNRIRAEKDRPRCDVFWNNEILNTLLLEEDGMLRPTRPANAALYSDAVKDPEGVWYGFAARARIILVNTDKVKDLSMIDSMSDLIEPQWKGQIGIAKPVAGTTATQAACWFEVLGADATMRYLQRLKDNAVQIESGNKACAENVGSGALAAAWTDTDDAMEEVEAGRPVRIVYPDDGPDGFGTLFIPNTLAAIKGSPNPEEADALINYLLSPAVEERLAKGPSAQIPLNKNSAGAGRVKGPSQVKAMEVDFRAAAKQWKAAQEFVTSKFVD